jgi:glyoxylase-like metal-dependent hydrolase (beta-lactamase superfamily II)
MAREHIKHWKIGAVDVFRLVEIHAERIDDSILLQDCGPHRVRSHPWLVPRFATPEGQILMNFQAFAVQVGGRRILVDTCVGNDKHRQAPIFHQLRTSFLDDLAAIGFHPESVDTVLCTHLHLDHVGWNTRLVGDRWVPTFPNARYLFGRKEWDFIHGLVNVPGAEVDHLPDSLQPVMEAGLVDFVESDHRVTPEIQLVPTPGHTPGHVSVHISSQGREAVITGDVVHHPMQCAEPDVRTNFCADHEQSRRTRREFLARCAENRTYVIGSHFCDPTAGWIVPAGDAWRFDAD